MLSSRSLSVMALVAPTLAWGSLPSLEGSARSLGGELGRATTFLRAPEPSLSDPEPDVVSGADARIPDERSALSTPVAKKRVRHAPPRVKPGHALRVSAGTVLRLSRGTQIPVGRTVPALRGRPAGIEVSSVSELGIGVRDGDVLTEVAGAPVTDAGEVVAAVLALRARHADAISAVFYRGSEPWLLTVEMPYL